MLIPLRDNIVIIQEEGVRETDAGIIIPEQAVERPNRGTVVALGPDVRGVADGDIVVYGKYAGVELIEDGQVYVVLCVQDLLAISRPNPSVSVPSANSSSPQLRLITTETKPGSGA